MEVIFQLFIQEIISSIHMLLQPVLPTPPMLTLPLTALISMVSTDSF